MICETKESAPRTEWNVAAVGDFGIDKPAAKEMFEVGLVAGAPEEVQWGP